MSADATGCKPDAGTPLGLYRYWGGNCQAWRIERTNTGSYVISSENGNRVVEVPGAVSTPGQQLSLWYYNGNNCQKWTINPANKNLRLASDNTETADETQIFPNPVTNKQFTINFGKRFDTEQVTTNIFDNHGKLVFKQISKDRNQIEVSTNLRAGAYILTIQNSKEQVTKKLLVQ